MSSRTRMPSRHARERGMAIAVALFAIAMLSLVLAAGLMMGGADAQATRAYKRTSQVHFVAESAIQHALQVANRSAGIGVENFNNDVVANWNNLWAPSTKTFSGINGYTYTVLALQNPADLPNSGYFRATAFGPEGATNEVVANVSRSVIPSTAPGALHLANGGQTNADFTGNAFSISGNDMNYTGGSGPGAPVPGISTLTQGNTQEAVNSLNSNQKSDVTGLGYSANPLIPSVKTSPGAPSAAQIDAMVADLLAQPSVVTQGSGTVNNSSNIQGWQCNANTQAAPVPEITHFTGDVTFKGNGNISGEGILIVDGNLTLNGKIDFKGLIIVRGATNVTSDTDVTGNASLWGSIWTTDINMVVGGSAFVQYSTQALALANQVSNGRAMPSKLVVNSMVDCAAVPANTNQCI